MGKFWVKMGISAIIVVALVILVRYLSKNISEEIDQTLNTTGIQQQWQEDEKRLRAGPEAEQQPKPEQPQQVQQPPIPQQTPGQTQEPNTPSTAQQPELQFKELSEIDQIEAERLLEMALFHRKTTRLQIGSKRSVDTCREIISRWPDSIYAYKAKRILADIPERYREQYNITKEEIYPFK